MKISCVCYSTSVRESFNYEHNFCAEDLVAQESLTKFFPCKVIIWLHSLDILDMKGIQTKVMHSSPHCCFGRNKLIGNSSDSSSRTALYHFQYVNLHLGSVLSLWSFTLSLWDSISFDDTLIHTAEHSPIWHSTVRKSLLIFFSHWSCITITKAIHAKMSVHSLLGNVVNEPKHCFLAQSNKAKLQVRTGYLN
jgi:hypothetical protein